MYAGSLCLLRSSVTSSSACCSDFEPAKEAARISHGPCSVVRSYVVGLVGGPFLNGMSDVQGESACKIPGPIPSIASKNNSASHHDLLMRCLIPHPSWKDPNGSKEESDCIRSDTGGPERKQSSGRC